MTSTIRNSVAFSMVFKACLVHSSGPFSRNLSVKITQLTTSWCSISWIIWTNVFVDDGDLPLRAAIISSQRSQHTPAVQCILSWPPCTSIWRYTHQITCCCILLLYQGLHTLFKCGSWVIFSLTAIAVLRWRNWCLQCCCVSARGALDEAPVIQLDSNSITLG